MSSFRVGRDGIIASKDPCGLLVGVGYVERNYVRLFVQTVGRRGHMCADKGCRNSVIRVTWTRDVDLTFRCRMWRGSAIDPL